MTDNEKPDSGAANQNQDSPPSSSTIEQPNPYANLDRRNPEPEGKSINQNRYERGQEQHRTGKE